MTSIQLESLLLRNFRNYAALDLRFSPGRNLILGANGQGKTNLLEAVHLLSHARSHRTSDDRELIQHGKETEGARIAGRVASAETGASSLLDMRFLPQQGRTGLRTVCRVEETVLRSRSKLLGHLPTVSFFLSDLDLVRGTPSDRRRWLDAAVTQMNRLHVDALTEFQRIHKQKSQLLKELGEQGQWQGSSVLDILNDQFIQASVRLLGSRLAYLAGLRERAARTYATLSHGADVELGLGYEIRGLETIFDNRQPSDAELTAGLVHLLGERQRDEIRRGVCLVGPHRDDLKLLLGGRDATAFASQGQQRTIVLALKLSELDCLTERLQTPPVLLLDDVMAELDRDRQRQLLVRLEQAGQVFLTTTHLDEERIRPFLDAREAMIYHVDGGTVALESVSGSMTAEVRHGF
jgi:DNA replication and repair protein RecF